MTTITGHKRLRKQFQESFTVSRFVELMTAATKAHEEAKIKDAITAKNYTVVEKEVYDITDTQQWLEWRRTKIMPSASMIASLYGIGYRSFNTEFKELVGITERGEHSGISKKMVDHGKDNEARAREVYLEHFKDERTCISDVGTRSRIMNISDGQASYDCLVTPDLRTTTESTSHCKVVEIKCPAYGIITHKKPLCEILDDLTTRFPMGRENHFLQVLMYATLFKTYRFDLFYFITDGISECDYRVEFQLTDKAQQFIFESISLCYTYINKYLEERVHDYPIVRRKANHLQRINAMMAECFIGSIRHDPKELQEQSSDEGEQ